MIWSNTSFGKLKEVVVGREAEFNTRFMDFSMKYFYKENIGQKIYENPYDRFEITEDVVAERIDDLNNLAKTLEQLGVKVHRPDKITKVIRFKTPTYQAEMTSASNVRDITWVYNNKIIETPTFVRNRFFENMSLYNVYDRAFDCGRGGQWIKSPITSLREARMDLDDWDEERDFSNFDVTKYDMAIDGAQFLRIGKDVIVNVSTYNHWLGLKWIESFFPDSNFYPVTVYDNHIDGILACLRPGVFLINKYFLNIKDMLPEKFKSWKFICPDECVDNIPTKKKTDINICLSSSTGLDINVLSIDENTVLVNKHAIGVIRYLEKEGFTVIPIKLDNGEIFAGGIHCSTLDLLREDEYIHYA